MTMPTLFLLFALLLLGACNGTDVGNPPRGELTHFDTSPCKNDSFDKGIDPLPAWQPDPAVYAGLTCVLWESAGDQLRVRLTNHKDGCHVDSVWKPRVNTSAEGVELVLDNPRCIFAGCGNCIYDLAFDVRVSELQERDPLELRVLGNDCHDERPVHHTLSLPRETRAQGARCSYTFENFSLLGESGSGGLHMPCGDVAPFGSVACSSGVCTEVSPGHRLCLAPCSADADCQPADVMACREGVCQLREEH
jgi:hypothetical protein